MTENFSIAFADLAAPAHAGGVDQRVAAPAALEIEIYRVARGTRLVERDDALLAEQRIDERGLADVRPADDGNPDTPLAIGLVVGIGVPRARCRERDVDQVADVFAVRRGNRQRLAQAELVELRNGSLGWKAFRLVDGEHDRPSRLAQQLGDVTVLGC